MVVPLSAEGLSTGLDRIRSVDTAVTVLPVTVVCVTVLCMTVVCVTVLDVSCSQVDMVVPLSAEGLSTGLDRIRSRRARGKVPPPQNPKCKVPPPKRGRGGVPPPPHKERG